MYQPGFPLSPADTPMSVAASPRTMAAGTLFALILAWLAADQLLLWRLLDVLPGWTYAAGLAIAAFLVRTAARGTSGRVGYRTLLTCLAIAFTLLLVGGEGRFFYANLDWQVRDAVLRDLAIHPWPFAYATDAGVQLLRAPIGMYLAPALAAKIAGQAGGDIALLAQNSLLLGTLLALASTMFDTRRARIIALATFLAFSGLDIVGQTLTGHLGAFTPTAHIEGWNRTQYSATITLAFWVPQHALAGWIPAVAFLLWRSGRLTIGALALTLPLVALWSPFGTLGALPFVLGAGLSELFAHRIRARDIALATASASLCLPGLIYLSAAGDAVGARFFPLAPQSWILLEALEVAPFLAFGWRFGDNRSGGSRFGGWPLALVTACLLLMPFGQIGWSIDFTMRASIPAFAILIAQLADILGGTQATIPRKAALVAILSVGAVTGTTEIIRGLTFPTAPTPGCGFSRAWDQSFASFPKDSYLAAFGRVPTAVRPATPTLAADRDPVRCYDRSWPRPPMFVAGEADRR
jgi:hypothetical protein